MDIQQLQLELRSVEERTQLLEAQRDLAARELAIWLEKKDLLTRLLALEGGTTTDKATLIARASTDSVEQNQLRRALLHSSRKPFEDEVCAILQRHEKPVHISQIKNALVNQGVTIPGKGTDANIISRITRDDRIRRAEGRRGFYLLSAKG